MLMDVKFDMGNHRTSLNSKTGNNYIYPSSTHVLLINSIII